jgi:hypothetical protein
LLGAYCELKIPNNKKSPTVWIVAVTSKHEDNKDLLLSFDSKVQAFDWFDAISWTIYLINNRYINLIHIREGSLSVTSTPQSTSLHHDIESWYLRQSLQFEEEFQFFSSGCRFKISSLHNTKNKKNKIKEQEQEEEKEEEETDGNSCCYLRGHQETLSLHWCHLYLEKTTPTVQLGRGGGGGGRNEIYKRSGLKTIPLTEIEDVLIGSYKIDEESADLKSEVKNSQILSIRTKFQSIDFIYPPPSDRASTARLERWIHSLISILHFLAIPVEIFPPFWTHLSLSLCLSVSLQADSSLNFSLNNFSS